MNDPRVVRFGSFEYRYCDGRLEWRVPGRTWMPEPHTPEEFAAVAELVNHPTVREVAAASRMRRLVYQEFKAVGMKGATADEIAKRLKMDVLNIRPRVTDLFNMGRLVKTDKRRATRLGNPARVLRVRLLPLSDP